MPGNLITVIAARCSCEEHLISHRLTKRVSPFHEMSRFPLAFRASGFAEGRCHQQSWGCENRGIPRQHPQHLSAPRGTPASAGQMLYVPNPWWTTSQIAAQPHSIPRGGWGALRGHPLGVLVTQRQKRRLPWGQCHWGPIPMAQLCREHLCH